VGPWGVMAMMIQANAAKDANGPYKPGYTVGEPTIALLDTAANDFRQDSGTTATPTVAGINYALTGTFDMGVHVTQILPGSGIAVPGQLLMYTDQVVMTIAWTGTGVDVNGNAQPAQPNVGD